MVNPDLEGLTRLIHIAHHLLDPLDRWNRVQRHDAALDTFAGVRTGSMHCIAIRNRPVVW